MTTDLFGCAICWPASADAAWQAYHSLDIDTWLVDESHFTVTIRSCDTCGQRFIAVFTETIDWIDGDDPQYWTVLPISEQEAGLLSRAGPAIVSVLERLAPQRRALLCNVPKGAVPTQYWSYGITVGPHD